MQSDHNGESTAAAKRTISVPRQVRQVLAGGMQMPLSGN